MNDLNRELYSGISRLRKPVFRTHCLDSNLELFPVYQDILERYMRAENGQYGS